MSPFRAGAIGFWLLFSSSAAWAVCPGIDVQFEDTFQSFKPSWGDPSPAVKVESGRMVLSPGSGTYVWAVNNAGLYDDIDMCVTVTTIQAVDQADAKAGLVFWYDDVNDFYVFEIAPDGRASVWRRQRGKWLAQVKWADAEGANKGDGAINELRVTAVGSDATFYVNGTEFKKISGSPPEKGQQIGLFAASPDAGQASFGFQGLKVTKP
jgi:hypothetical protein